MTTQNTEKMTRTYTFQGRSGAAYAAAAYGIAGDNMAEVKRAFIKLGESLGLELVTNKAYIEHNPDRTSGFADIAVIDDTNSRFVATVTVRYQVTERQHFSFLAHEPIALTGTGISFRDTEGHNYFELTAIY